MTLVPQAAIVRRTNTIGLIAILGLLTSFLPEQVQARTKRKAAHREDAFSGSAIAKANPKYKASRVRRHSPARPRFAKGKVRKAAHANRAACAEAFDKATERIQDGHLREAQELSSKCTLAICGRFLKQECTKLQTKLQVDTPSVIPVVTDASATMASRVEVKMDGDVLASKIDGQPIPIDPGNHQFTFSAENEVFATEDLLIGPGQRNHQIVVSMHGRTTAAVKSRPGAEDSDRTATDSEKNARKDNPDVDSEDGDRRQDSDEPETGIVARRSKSRLDDGRSAGHASWPAYALGGAGLLGVGGYLALTLKGRQDNNTLVQSCKPDCKPESVHHIRLLYLAADISLGVGLAALAASTWLFLRSPDGARKASTRTAHIRSLDVQPTPTGALATVGGIF